MVRNDSISKSKTTPQTHSNVSVEISQKIIPLNENRVLRVEKTVSNKSVIKTENLTPKLSTNIIHIWCSVLYKKYSIYLSLFAHILDSTSSISVLILWVYSSTLDSNSDLLFVIFVLYRIILSIYIYNITNKISDIFLQFIF